MTAQRWLAVTLATLLAVVGTCVAFNVAIDLYGLFRDPAGRRLQVYGDERLAKFLLSMRYVPANFDAVLIGSSVSENWDVDSIRSARVYNDSLNGGDITEERALLDQLVGAPRLDMVLLVVHPYLTASHEFKTLPLKPSEKWSALGSLGLLDAYKNAVRIRLGSERATFNASGTEDFGAATQKLNAHLQAMWQPQSEFEVDPVAFQEYLATISELHARGVPIVFIVPPTAQALLGPKAAAFDRYARSILEHRGPRDRVLDFTSPEFEGFRNEEANFSDGVHLAREGAARLTQILDERLRDWRSDGWPERSGAAGRTPETPATPKAPQDPEAPDVERR